MRIVFDKLLIISILILSVFSCTSPIDEKYIVRLTLSEDGYYPDLLCAVNDSIKISILTGTGEYSVTVSNSCAEANIKENLVSIIGKKIGKTRVVVMDLNTEEEKGVDVNITDLELEDTKVTIKEKMDKYIKILNGSGEYKVIVENKEIVSVDLCQDSYNGSRLQVLGKKVGKTKVIVTDLKINRKQTIEITVE